MQKEIVLHPEAQDLKDLGFDEVCFRYIYTGDTGNNADIPCEVLPSKAKNYNEDDLCVSTPTYSQAFEFFEEKFKLFPTLHVDQTMEPKFGYSIAEFFEDEEGLFDWKDIMSSYLYYTRQESKLECLRELIKIAKNRKQ
jgi:hypothetical protein